ncbi:MAG: Uncharacterised protein [Polaribacter sp. SA4-10]|nr:MAG: Uncharacterised protein [Polaribacter sp. SA4-10]|tara:strand:+ start:16 stop:1026 length:1011 start_codon:yes stop_codon:yes gene_type:complete
MKQERTFLHKLNLFLKGLVMGIANKVPGVSGGTVSFVLNFYEELIYSFKKINLGGLKLLMKGELKSFYVHINGQFLLLIMGGSLFSYFSLSLVLDYFLANYELYVWSWFFGMIVGSIFYIGKDFSKWNFKIIIFLVIGVSIGIGVSFLTPAKENDNLWFVFFCGIIGVSGMTLPGLSGSFILILLGNYVLLLVDSVNVLSKVITEVFSGDFSVFRDEVKIRYLKVIAVFTGGSLFGLITMSHILGYVIKRWKHFVNAVIIGFITGSLGIVWPWKKTVFLEENGVFILDSKRNKIVENYERFIPEFSNNETWFAFLYMALGLGLILVLDFYGRKSKK